MANSRAYDCLSREDLLRLLRERYRDEAGGLCLRHSLSKIAGFFSRLQGAIRLMHVRRALAHD